MHTSLYTGEGAWYNTKHVSRVIPGARGDMHILHTL